MIPTTMAVVAGRWVKFVFSARTCPITATNLPKTFDEVKQETFCDKFGLLFSCVRTCTNTLHFFQCRHDWFCCYSTDIVRSHTSFNILPIELKESSREELRDLFRALSDIEVEDRCLDVFAEASGFAAEYFLERFQALRNMSSELWKEGQPALVETSEDLTFHIPPRLVRKNKDIKVSEIKAEIAMLFASLFDEIPPLCQMVLKIVTIATRRGFYKLPYKILEDCMNDLIANGVERSVLDVILAELVDIFVIKFEGTDVAKPAWNDVLSIQNPALADTAMEVSYSTAFYFEPNFDTISIDS